MKKQTNILKALANLRKVNDFSLPAHYNSSNRMNSMGIALEYFVKDAFCSSIGLRDIAGKDGAYSEYLSYIGNANNPPDFMIENGDAVEVKKIQSFNSGLALNSSYPKNKLYSDSTLITDACRKCEDWSERDIIYAVGVVREKMLKLLWFVYGDCYAADRKIYETTRDKVIKGIQGIGSLEFSRTRELGRVNRVDPLGITYLRIRGMWGIENPIRVFDYLKIKREKSPSILAIMRSEKFNSFPRIDRELLTGKGFIARDIKIKDPDNPAKIIPAKIIELS